MFTQYPVLYLCSAADFPQLPIYGMGAGKGEAVIERGDPPDVTKSWLQKMWSITSLTSSLEDYFFLHM